MCVVEQKLNSQVLSKCKKCCFDVQFWSWKRSVAFSYNFGLWKFCVLWGITPKVSLSFIFPDS